MTTSSILGQYEANKASSGTTDRVATDKDTFLKLLVAQLTHQDPLNPTEDKEFIAQLAQFTQVEELQNIRSAVDTLNETMSVQQVTNAASLLGLLVLAKGDNLYMPTNADGQSYATDLNPDDPLQTGWLPIYFQPQQDIAEGILNIIECDADGNPTGKIVYSMKLASNSYKEGKDYELKWHGRGFAGEVMPTGSYIFSFVCENSAGNSVMVDSYSTGQVIGVETATDGNHKLNLHDGRSVNYMEIRQLQAVLNNNSGTSKEDQIKAYEEAIEKIDTQLATLNAAKDQLTDPDLIAELEEQIEALEKQKEELEEAKKKLEES